MSWFYLLSSVIYRNNFFKIIMGIFENVIVLLKSDAYGSNFKEITANG